MRVSLGEPTEPDPLQGSLHPRAGLGCREVTTSQRVGDVAVDAQVGP